MSLTLASAPRGVLVRITDTASAAGLARRLGELGLRPGAVVQCAQGTAGGGRVVEVAGARLALGRSVLQAVHAEVCPPQQNTP